MPQHRFAGMTVTEILPYKKQSILSVPLESDSPSWSEIESVTWEEINDRASQSLPGYKTIRKLLSDRRFDK